MAAHIMKYQKRVDCKVGNGEMTNSGRAFDPLFTFKYLLYSLVGFIIISLLTIKTPSIELTQLCDVHNIRAGKQK